MFVVFGAPVVGSGTPTFAGYLALPDTSHQLALANMLPDHGLQWPALAPGSLRSSMAELRPTAYPIGGQAALGVTAPLGVLDLAWLYQPFLSWLALVRRWRSRRRRPAAAPPLAVALAFVVAQSALVWGSRCRARSRSSRRSPRS